MLFVYPKPKSMLTPLRYADMKPRQVYPRVLLPELAKPRPRLGLTYRVTALNDGVPFRYQLIAKSSTDAMLLAKELLPGLELISVAREGEW
jgi:hypothetical protein